ncbi:hypothetical protein L6452_31927 [Arctium lappa]|uniref:Uncharacterized protein n=1 Tax=Arctium lappa TaxID=4217 RepID=A0ACB8Z421_ARCLA|nr:hypothetical protein L6452_31927 [Arctium lappa]
MEVADFLLRIRWVERPVKGWSRDEYEAEIERDAGSFSSPRISADTDFHFFTSYSISADAPSSDAQTAQFLSAPSRDDALGFRALNDGLKP